MPKHLKTQVFYNLKQAGRIALASCDLINLLIGSGCFNLDPAKNPCLAQGLRTQ